MGYIKAELSFFVGRLVQEAMSSGLRWDEAVAAPEHLQFGMTEVIPFGFSMLDRAASAFKVHACDGRETEVRSDADLHALFEGIRLSTEKRLRDYLGAGKRKIGFVA